MSFVEILERARALLERNGRLSLRALRLEFSLEEEQLQALVEELVDVQQVASREGKVLAWMGPASAAPHEIERVAAEKLEDAAAGERRSRDIKGERRQLTVLFCDLVGSTDLSRRIDGEDLRDLMRSYHASASEVIARFEGHIAQYLGDGLLVYFGFPQAGEDDPERAVRAGLALVDALDELNPRLASEGKPQLALRVGIHTGTVVVGEMGGGTKREIHAVGEAMNVAARMQGEAEPNAVVMSPETLRLVEGVFVTRDLGAREVRGIGEVHVHQATGVRSARSRLDADVDGLTTLVGRDGELGLLLDRWEQVKESHGQAALISGEAGLGKSRLTRALRERLSGRPHTWMACQCSRDRRGSAYYPLLELMERGVGFQPGDSPEQKLARLESAIEAAGVETLEAVPLLASLLSLPVPDRYPPLHYSPELQQRKTIESLCTWVIALSANQPLVMLVEDLHWCDPSTMEFVTLLLEQSPTAPVLILLSFRPDFEPPWPARSHAMRLEVGRLGRQQAEHLVEGMTRDEPLPSDVLERIVARADGVPLFLEELTKMVLESRRGKASGGVIEFTVDAIPATLHGSLMARLDRLKRGKQVAQLGSVLGRRFSYELLRAVSSAGDTELATALRGLTEAELLHARGAPPDAIYSFKHALIQDTAYQSMLRRERRELHAATAKALEDRFPEVVDSAPEVLARHYDEAGLAEQAIAKYQKAASRAKRQFASEEAIAHLRRAIEVTASLPESPQSKRMELGLQLAIGSPLYTARGWADREYGDSLERCRALAAEIGNDSEMMHIWMGLYFHHQVGGELAKAEQCARRALELAEQTTGLADDVVARAALSQTLYLQAEFKPALEQLEHVISLYTAQERELHSETLLRPASSDASSPGQAKAANARVPLPSTDGGAMSALWGVRALCRWALGYPDEALDLCSAALDSAMQLGTPFNLASAYIYAGWIHQKRGVRSEALRCAQEAHDLSERLGFSWLPWTNVLVGSVRVDSDRHEAGHAELVISQVQKGIDLLAAAGTKGWVPHCFSAQAETFWRLDRPAEALAAVDHGLACAAETGQHYEDSELLRLRGEVLCARDAEGSDAAQAAFLAALETARRHKARSQELRAATGLARLLQKREERARGHALLAPVHAWFSEGFETEDWRNAERLLAELS